MDRYQSFAALEAGEVLGVDYIIVAEQRQSGIAVVAPRGGQIEPDAQGETAVPHGNEPRRRWKQATWWCNFSDIQKCES